MKKIVIRDFYLILLLTLGLIGFRLSGAQEADLNKAMVLVNEGRSDEAIVLLNQEIDKDPRAPEARLALGVAFLQRGELDRARESLEKAISLDPASVPAHYSLAMLFEKQKQTAGAVAAWRKVAQYSTDSNLKDMAAKHIRQLEGNRP